MSAASQWAVAVGWAVSAASFFTLAFLDEPKRITPAFAAGAFGLALIIGVLMP